MGYSKYFYGYEVSEYALENGMVDYRTLAETFNHVLNNDIIEVTSKAGLGYWEQYSYNGSYDDEIDELREKIEELELLEDSEENDEEINNLEDQIATLEEYRDSTEVFQWYIVDYSGAQILKDAHEIVYYNEELDIYLWGVTHWGTSWDYVLTRIPLREV